MKTEVIAINEDFESSQQQMADIKRAGEIIRQGGLVAFPTETVYGLGGDTSELQKSTKLQNKSESNEQQD